MNILHWKKRPFIYGIVLTVGFAFLINLLENLPNQFFYIGVVVLYIVLLFELFSTTYYAKRLLDQFEFPPVESKDNAIQFIHHSLLPTLTYISLVLFVFFNHQHSLNFFILLLVFIIFSTLFTNIRAFHEDKFRLEMITHNIYDFLMLVITFIATDSLLQAFGYTSTQLPVTILILFLILFCLNMMVLIRYHMWDKKHAFIQTFLLICFMPLIVFLVTQQFSSLIVSFLTTIFFYYIIAYLNHLLEGTATAKVLAEYVIVFVLLVIILFGIA